MSKLLENLIKNRQSQTLREFDMTRSGSAMMRHLGVGYPSEPVDVPIEPEKPSWQQFQQGGKNIIQKTYELQNAKFLLYFVNELINLSESMHHHPEIFIDHTTVTITLYTKDLNDVTELDLEMSQKIDEIIEDINIIRFR